MIVVQSLFVKRVPRFVHHSIKTGKRVCLIKTSGEPGVAGPQSCGKRMGRGVHSTGLEIEAHVRGNRFAKGLLSLNREPQILGEHGLFRPRLGFGDGVEQRNQALAQPGEERIVVLHRHADLVLIEQNIVWCRGDTEEFDFFLGEGDQVGERWFERSKI